MAPLATLLILASPGCVLSWFRLQWGERTVALCVALFLASLAWPAWWGGAIGVLAATVAIFYKEPAFLSFMVFGLFNEHVGHPELRNTLLIVPVFAYLAMAAYVRLRYADEPYTTSIYPHWQVTLKNLTNYAFFSDPVVMLVGMPMALLHPTPALLAGAAYVLVYLVVNTYTPYYLLPALVWMLPSLVAAYHSGVFAGPWWSADFVLVGIVLVGNTLPATLHYLTHEKYLNANFQATVEFLASDLS